MNKKTFIQTSAFTFAVAAILILSGCSNRRYSNRTNFQFIKKTKTEKVIAERNAKKTTENHLVQNDVQPKESANIESLNADQSLTKTKDQPTTVAENFKLPTSKTELKATISGLKKANKASLASSTSEQITTNELNPVISNKLAEGNEIKVPKKIAKISKKNNSKDNVGDLLYLILVVILVLLLLSLIGSLISTELFGLLVLIVLIVLLFKLLGMI